MMKAVYVNSWVQAGTVAESVIVGELPLPRDPVRDEVSIQVHASAINVDDVALCQDTAGGGWFFHGKKPTEKEPFIGGCEYSGVVLKIGPQVTRLKVGDRVCGVQDRAVKKLPGTWAEQTLAPEGHVVRIPDGCDISFVQAAGAGMGAMVSWDMYKRARLGQVGQHVRCLVVGASGGLGTFLLRVLKKQLSSVTVVAVCSASKAQSVLELGADEVVDYAKAPFGEQLANAEKFDAVFDFVGGSAVERNGVRLLKTGGKFITAVGPTAGIGDRMLSC
eukprot:g796.t1